MEKLHNVIIYSLNEPTVTLQTTENEIIETCEEIRNM
jgi:hypothetical protein